MKFKSIKKICSFSLVFLLMISIFSTNVHALSEPANLEMTRTTAGNNQNVDLNKIIGAGTVTTSFLTKYTNSTENGTFPAGSSIYETLDYDTEYQITKISVPFISGDKTNVSIYLNDSTALHEKISYSTLQSKDYSFPEGTTSYLLVFNEQIKFATYAQSITTTIDSRANVTLSKAPKSTLVINLNTSNPIQKTKSVDFNNAAISYIFGAASNKNISYPTLAFSGCKELPNQIVYNTTPLIGANTSSKGLCYTTTHNTRIISHMAEEMKLKQLTVPKSSFVYGKDGVQGTESTFDVYINGEIYKTKQSTLEEHTYTFDGDKYLEFELVYADGTTFIYSMDSRVMYALDTISATYNIDTTTKQTNFNNYMEFKTTIKGKEVSSLDSDIAQYSMDLGYGFLRKLSLNNVAEKTKYVPEEDIVFELSNINMAKYIGDYSYAYIWLKTSKNLDNYYIKSVEITRELSDTTPFDPTSSISTEDNKEAISGSSLESYTIENTNNNLNLNTFNFHSLVRPIMGTRLSSDLINQYSNYELADIMGGAKVGNISIKIIYGQKPNQPITKTTDFINSVNLTIAPTNNPNGQLAQTVDIIGKTRIIVPAYKVSYDGNQGQGTMKDGDNPYASGDTTTVLENEFTRDGYTFINWNIEADGSGTTYTKDDILTIQKNVTLYAQWAPNITFDPNNGNWQGDTDTKTVIADKDGKVSIPTDPAREGYTFKGWYPNQDGTGDKLETDDTFTKPTTLYAKWSPNITFDPNSGNWQGNTNTKTVVADENGKILIPETPTHKGYTFKGWYLNQDGTGNILKTDDTFTKPATFYAKWEAVEEINVSYQWVGLDYPSDVTLPNTETINKGSAYTPQWSTYPHSLYTFDGWYLDKEGTNKFINGSVLNSDTILYGKWIKNGLVDPDNPVNPDNPFDPNPNKPVTPDSSKPSTSDKVANTNKVNNPRTGDNISTALILNTLMLSAIIVVIVTRRKRIYKK